MNIGKDTRNSIFMKTLSIFYVKFCNDHFCQSDIHTHTERSHRNDHLSRTIAITDKDLSEAKFVLSSSVCYLARTQNFVAPRWSSKFLFKSVKIEWKYSGKWRKVLRQQLTEGETRNEVKRQWKQTKIVTKNYHTESPPWHTRTKRKSQWNDEKKLQQRTSVSWKLMNLFWT
jgi:hypothetical protein